MVVTGNYERSGEIYDDLQFFGVERTFHYPKSQALPYDEDEPLLEEQVKHLEFLHHLVECAEGAASCDQSATRVVSVGALFTRVAPIDVLKDLIFRINWGQRLDPEDFALRAADLGYERVPTVEARGEFAIRGGILDIRRMRRIRSVSICLAMKSKACARLISTRSARFAVATILSRS